MNAARRCDKLRRVYGIKTVTRVEAKTVLDRMKAEYRVEFKDREPVTVFVPKLGHTESTILTAVATVLTREGFAPKY